MHKPLEIRIIDRLFQRFEGRWLNQWTDKFRGIDVANVKAEWAEDLAGFAGNLEALRYAFDVVKDSSFPPNLPEFKAAARRAPAKELPSLQHKMTSDDIQHAKEMAEKVARVVKPKEFDGLLWAKKPRSQMAMNMVADAKREHRKFPALAAVFDQLVADGIATVEGKLLQRWDGAGWVKC